MNAQENEISSKLVYYHHDVSYFAGFSQKAKAGNSQHHPVAKQGTLTAQRTDKVPVKQKHNQP